MIDTTALAIALEHLEKEHCRLDRFSEEFKWTNKQMKIITRLIIETHEYNLGRSR